MANILVIDDEATICENLVRFLKLEGHAVVEAVDGISGLEAVRQARPDFILRDVMMQHIDGFEVLAAVRAQTGNPTIPFVFLSASAEPEKLVQTLQQGAQGHVAKPFNLARLRQLLVQFLPK